MCELSYWFNYFNGECVIETYLPCELDYFYTIFSKEVVNNAILGLSAGILTTPTLHLFHLIHFQGFLHRGVTEVCNEQKISPILCRTSTWWQIKLMNLWKFPLPSIVLCTERITINLLGKQLESSCTIRNRLTQIFPQAQNWASQPL